MTNTCYSDHKETNLFNTYDNTFISCTFILYIYILPFIIIILKNDTCNGADGVHQYPFDINVINVYPLVHGRESLFFLFFFF